MLLRKAYREMMKTMDDPTIWKVKPQTLFQARHDLKKGIYPAEKTMRKRLLRSGYRKLSDEEWGQVL